jgi:alanine dehydrogenase
VFIGAPKEIKPGEYRVGLVPSTIRELVANGHEVAVEQGAGLGAGISDQDYEEAGARIVPDADQVYAGVDLVVKVKEPLAGERKKLRQGQIVFTYLHLAADLEQTRDLLSAGITAIAYETVTDAEGKLPLLAPMSKVAGRMVAQVAAHFLERPQGGRGILLGGIDGLPAADVLILGGGVVGSNAAEIALGMGAKVTITARSTRTRDRLSQQFGSHVPILASTPEETAVLCVAADVVVGAALVDGGAAPKLISAETVKRMKPGAVIVDVSIDQGGCAETSHPTTHSQPTFVVDGVIHYCVANMPGAVPRTSTFALNNATRPFILALADKGLQRALSDDEHFRAGLNVHNDKLTCRAVAEAFGLPYTPAGDALRI